MEQKITLKIPKTVAMLPYRNTIPTVMEQMYEMLDIVKCFNDDGSLTMTLIAGEEDEEL